VDLISGFTMPFALLPSLPLEGVSSDEGADLGGFPAALWQGGKMRCNEAEWTARLEAVNEHCARLWTGKGKGRNRLLEDRETTCEQNHGNVRLDVTFALRRGTQMGLDCAPVLERMAIAVQVALETTFPGVRVAGVVIHPPNPFVDAAESLESGGTDSSRASGMNLHPQVYTYRAFGGHWTSNHHKGFSHVEEFVVAGLQHDELGIDVHKYGRVREGVRREWWYRVANEEDLKELEAADKTASARVRRVRQKIAEGKSTIEKEVASDMKRWDASWQRTGTKSKTLLDVLKRNHATAAASQGEAVNWWFSQWATKFLLEELPKHDPRWQEHLQWGVSTAKAVLDAHVESRFQTPLLALLERFEQRDLLTKFKAVSSQLYQAVTETGKARAKAEMLESKVKQVGSRMAIEAVQAQALRKLETLEDAVETLMTGGPLTERQRRYFSRDTEEKWRWGNATLASALGPAPSADIANRAERLSRLYTAYLAQPAKATPTRPARQPDTSAPMSRLSNEESVLAAIEGATTDAPPSPDSDDQEPATISHR